VNFKESLGFITIVLFHQDLGSKLKGYWFYTKEERWQCKQVRTPKNIAVVKEAIERCPHRLSVSLGLSEASVRRILHKDLHFYPYKIQVTSNSARSQTNSCGDASKDNG
jgi:hypothetical protein